VGFRSQVTHCSEDDGEICYFLTRDGHCSTQVVVKVHADTFKDAWGKYHVRKPNLSVTFAPGDKVKSFKYELMDNDSWALMNEFQIVICDLCETHVDIASSKCSTNGQPLTPTMIRPEFGSMIVKVLDDDFWPSNEAGLEVKNGTKHGILFALWGERWKKNGIKAKTSAAVMIFKAVWSVAQLYMYKIIIDYGIKEKDLWVLGVCVSVFLIMVCVNWWADNVLEVNRGRSGSRKDFRGWLVRKWLGLSADQQMIVGPYEFINTTNNTVEEVAVGVWWAFFQTLYLAVWVLFAFVAIAIVAPFYLIWPVVILCTTYIFTIPGAGEYRRLIKDRVDADAAWNLSLGTVIEDARVAQIYGQSGPLIKSFDEVYEKFYWANRNAQLDKIYFENSSSFAVSIGFASFIVVAGTAVVHESLTMGDFTALLTILKSFSDRVADAARLTMSIQRGLVHLVRVMGILNLPDCNEEDKAMAEIYFNQYVLQKYHAAGILGTDYPVGGERSRSIKCSTGTDVDTGTGTGADADADTGADTGAAGSCGEDAQQSSDGRPDSIGRVPPPLEKPGRQASDDGVNVRDADAAEGGKSGFSERRLNSKPSVR